MQSFQQHSQTLRTPLASEPEHSYNASHSLAVSYAKGKAPPLILSALLISFMPVQVSLLPLKTSIIFGADEGFELAKTELCVRGHALYSEIWNDQPPLHTFLLTKLTKLTDRNSDSKTSANSNLIQAAHSALGPRLLTTAFTALLLFSVFSLVRRASGLLVAVLATVLLIASPGFIELSASCMLEIPSLSPALCALAVLAPPSGELQNTQKPLRYLSCLLLRQITAGLLFGLALQIKLVPAMLLPLAALLLWSGSGPFPSNLFSVASVKQFLRAFLPFGLALLVAYIGIDLLIERGAYLIHFKQSWASHFGTAKSTEYGTAADHPFDWPVLLRNWDTSIPALIGIFVLASAFPITVLLRKEQNRKSTAHPSFGHLDLIGHSSFVIPSFAGSHYPDTPALLLLLPLFWLLLALAVFTTHKPWWPYYYIHLAIPLCWCAAIGLSFLIRTVFRLLPDEKSLMPAQVPGSASPLPSGEGRGEGGFRSAQKHKNSKRPTSAPARGRKRPIFAVAALSFFLLCTTAWQIGRVYLQVTGIRSSPQTYSSLVLAELLRYKPFTDWLYTDDLVFSFHAGIPVPPQLAVVPLKRLWSGEMTNARIADEMDKYRPGLILLRNPQGEVPFQRLLASEYQLVFQDPTHSLYAHRTIANKPRPQPL